MALTCGHNYENWSDKSIQNMIDMLQSILDKRKPEKRTENIHDILPKHTQVYKK